MAPCDGFGNSDRPRGGAGQTGPDLPEGNHVQALGAPVVLAPAERRHWEALKFLRAKLPDRHIVVALRVIGDGGIGAGGEAGTCLQRLQPVLQTAGLVLVQAVVEGFPQSSHALHVSGEEVVDGLQDGQRSQPRQLLVQAQAAAEERDGGRGVGEAYPLPFRRQSRALHAEQQAGPLVPWNSQIIEGAFGPLNSGGHQGLEELLTRGRGGLHSKRVVSRGGRVRHEGLVGKTGERYTTGGCGGSAGRGEGGGGGGGEGGGEVPGQRQIGGRGRQGVGIRRALIVIFVVVVI